MSAFACAGIDAVRVCMCLAWLRSREVVWDLNVFENDYVGIGWCRQVELLMLALLFSFSKLFCFVC